MPDLMHNDCPGMAIIRNIVYLQPSVQRCVRPRITPVVVMTLIGDIARAANRLSLGHALRVWVRIQHEPGQFYCERLVGRRGLTVAKSRELEVEPSPPRRGNRFSHELAEDSVGLGGVVARGLEAYRDAGDGVG